MRKVYKLPEVCALHQERGPDFRIHVDFFFQCPCCCDPRCYADENVLPVAAAMSYTTTNTTNNNTN